MSIRRWIFTLPSRSLPARLAALAAAVLLIYGCVIVAICSTAALGCAGRFCTAGGGCATSSGTTGVMAASVAAGVCLASAAVALMTSHWIGSLANGAAGMLLPMMVRTAPPLLLALIVRLRGQALVEAGFVYYLVGFYLLALALEVPMSLPRGQRPPGHGDTTERKGWKANG